MHAMFMKKLEAEGGAAYRKVMAARDRADKSMHGSIEIQNYDRICHEYMANPEAFTAIAEAGPKSRN